MTNAHCPTAICPPSSGMADQDEVKALVRTGLTRLTRLISVARQRRQLATLDDHQLRDIGITRQQAQTEARRPFWDLP